MGEIRFHNTVHLSQRVDLRCLSTENIKNTVKYPDQKIFQKIGKRKGKVYLFKKTVDGITLNVVAEMKRDECWIITSYEC